MQSREIRLKRYPNGMPVPEDFALAEVAVPEPGPGQVAVRNLFLSVDPYMRGRMNPGRKSYVPPFELGKALSGDAVGRVVASRDGRFPVGAHVLSFNGWREGFVAEAKHLEAIEPEGIPPSAFLGILGMPGLTAYGGLAEKKFTTLAEAKKPQALTLDPAGAVLVYDNVAQRVLRFK